ncbi:MAG: aminotransferase class V-fold PLP-dependent enzyme [Planctomycetaceae bacterium]
MQRIYLDNAATSFPKPAAVYDAVDRYNRQIGAAVGRGAYGEAMESQRVVDRCRKRAADLFGAADVNRVLFTFNGTDSLNLALHGLIDAGDRVVTSAIEHNSVLRPLRELKDRWNVEVTHVPAERDGRIDVARFREAIRPGTKVVSLIHASNVSGVLQPIAEVGELARRAGAVFVVDAAQTAGHVPIDMSALPIDVLCSPGHKGLLGPLGTGLVVLGRGMEERLRSFRQGGTGSVSEQEQQPSTLPDKYESGNHNAPGLFGLEAALAWIDEQGIDSLRQHERRLTERLIDGLSGNPAIVVHGSTDPDDRVGVVSFTIEGYEPQILASILDENFHVQTRAGLHCAPGAHRCLGTLESGGTVRLSVGPFTTEGEIDAAISAITEVAGAI